MKHLIVNILLMGIYAHSNATKNIDAETLPQPGRDRCRERKKRERAERRIAGRYRGGRPV